MVDAIYIYFLLIINRKKIAILFHVYMCVCMRFGDDGRGAGVYYFICFFFFWVSEEKYTAFHIHTQRDTLCPYGFILDFVATAAGWLKILFLEQASY